MKEICEREIARIQLEDDMQTRQEQYYQLHQSGDSKDKCVDENGGMIVMYEASLGDISMSSLSSCDFSGRDSIGSTVSAEGSQCMDKEHGLEQNGQEKEDGSWSKRRVGAEYEFRLDVDF